MSKYEKKVDKYAAKAIKFLARRGRRYWRSARKKKIWIGIGRDLAVVGIAALLIFGGSILSPVVAEETPLEEAPADSIAPADSTSETPSENQPSDQASESSSETPAEESSQPTTIETGDAVSVVEVENEVNTNTVDTNGDQEEETNDNASTAPPSETEEVNTLETEIEGETATSSASSSQSQASTATSTATSTAEQPESPDENGPELSGGGGGVELTVEGQNTATTTANATSTALTGQNEASQNPGDVIIDTGNAFAYADVVNVVNTNIVDSNGFFVLMNAFSQLFGDIDFRGVGFEPLGNACPGDACSLYDSLEVSTLNYATTTSNVAVTANTGQNVAESNDGSTIVRTGRAAAGANVVNVVNTNIVESNYLLVTINQFNGWIGDLVLPAKSFFQRLFSPFFGEKLTVANQNTADVENNVSAEAETGVNEANENEDEAVIETGGAAAGANVVNSVNTNLTGGTSVMILVQIHGNWTGNIFSTPEGITWERTSNGLSIYGLDVETIGSSGFTKTIAVENENYGNVVNNVSVVALTGENQANGNGRASIATGNAAAGANVVNVVNTNIVGHNWLLALVNVFGDWQGNVAFGRPDLWVGSSVEAGNPALEGNLASYSVTVANRGDTDATNVRLTSSFNNNLLEVNNDGGVQGEGNVTWELGALAPGASVNIAFTGQVANGLEHGTNTIENSFTATAYEPDEDSTDNTDTVAFAAFKPPIYYTNGGGEAVAGAGGLIKLSVKKSYTGPSAVTSGSTMPFKIVLTNESDYSAYNVVVKDYLTDSTGLVVQEKAWPLGEVFAREEIVIDYNLKVEDTAPAGTYTSQAFAFGQNSAGVSVESNIATSSFEILAAPPKPLATIKKLASPSTAEAETVVPRFVEYIPAAPSTVSPTLLASLLNLVSGFWAAAAALIALALIFFFRSRRTN